MAMRQYFSLFFLLLMTFIILLEPLNCRAASLSWDSASPVNDTITVAASASACNSGHHCLVDDEADPNLFGSMDPQYLSSLANSIAQKDIAHKALVPDNPAVAGCADKGRYTSCLGVQQTVNKHTQVCAGADIYCRDNRPRL